MMAVARGACFKRGFDPLWMESNVALGQREGDTEQSMADVEVVGLASVEQGSKRTRRARKGDILNSRLSLFGV